MKLTPAMKQYVEMKKKYPDCVIFFRMGDFYETFYEDAETTSKELNITLTARGKGEGRAPLAGIPYHALDGYLSKMIKKGYKVAICEQLEDPRKAKGLVKRDVIRVVTPGTVLESSVLNEKHNNYIMCISCEENQYGVAIADISTGEFLTTQLNDIQKLKNEIIRFSPTEVIINSASKELIDFFDQNNIFMNSYDEKFFFYNKAYQELIQHFQTISLDGFGIENKELSISACGALFSYLKETQKKSLSYINKIRQFSVDNFMMLDATTIRNLELVKNMRTGTTKGTLLEVIDFTKTPMGSRILKKWIQHPLMDIGLIKQRHDSVEELFKKTLLREELRHILSKISDIERLITRVAYGNANARDLVSLKSSLAAIPKLKEQLEQCNSPLLVDISKINDVKQVVELIEKGIKPEPAAVLNAGNIIKEGYNEQLDQLRSICSGGKEWITELEKQERDKTGIKSLKLRYNRVFGYFIEVTKPNLHLVPKDYIRKQTQVNAERFITEELKEKESQILGAEERMIELEQDIFNSITSGIAKETEQIQQIANSIGELDVLNSFALAAINNSYVKPEVNNSDEINITEGRHAVLEKTEAVFIPNSIALNEKNRVMIITGPNMAGKSSLMRQVALIVLLAQIGSFVPALGAKIGITDRIFTRIGAFDDLTLGQSTFMVEMNEVASILNNATPKSLIILDEIGRGTSTFDGVSIAWSVIEYIAKRIKAKTMFATHYHVLNKLAEEFSEVNNFNIGVKEKDDAIIFLRKILEGGTNKSYGIQVARLAGLPQEVIVRSKEIQAVLEKQDEMKKKLNVDKSQTKQIKLSDL